MIQLIFETAQVDHDTCVYQDKIYQYGERFDTLAQNLTIKLIHKQLVIFRVCIRDKLF